MPTEYPTEAPADDGDGHVVAVVELLFGEIGRLILVEHLLLEFMRFFMHWMMGEI